MNVQLLFTVLVTLNNELWLVSFSTDVWVFDGHYYSVTKYIFICGFSFLGTNANLCGLVIQLFPIVLHRDFVDVHIGWSDFFIISVICVVKIYAASFSRIIFISFLRHHY